MAATRNSISGRCCRAMPRSGIPATHRRLRRFRNGKRGRRNHGSNIKYALPPGFLSATFRPSRRLSMTKLSLSRRAFLGGAAAIPFVVSGIAGPARAADITVGIIYVGSRQDYGWNQAHAVGAQALQEIPGGTVVGEEDVPEKGA